MRFNHVLRQATLLSTLFMFTYCNEPEINPAPEVPQGTLVLCEGNFLSSNADLSLFDKTNRTIQNDVFFRKNNRPLGDVLQSGALQGEVLYAVMNNSNRVEVLNASNFGAIRTINGFSLPRYIIVKGTTAFVSEWISFSGNGRVAVVDLQSGTIKRTLPAGKFPERMHLLNSLLYVANSDDSTITVINTETETIESTTAIGPGPNSFAQVGQKLYVLCGGLIRRKPDFSIDSAACVAGELLEITPQATPLVSRRTVAFNDRFLTASRLTTNNRELYFTYNNAVYRSATDTLSAPTSPWVNRTGSDASVPVYGLGVDPSTGIVYVAFSNFTSANRVNRYRPDGTFIDSYNTSAGPNGFLFR